MKLIDLLLQELPKRGGWPVGAAHAWADPDGEIRFRGVGVSYDFYPAIAQVDKLAGVPGIFHEDTWRYIITRDQYEAALAAAQQPVWNGGGLPPVGCECLVKVGPVGNPSWVCCSIVYSGSAGIAFVYSDGQTLDCVGTGREDYFRPIRTEAECKRDEAIAAIVDFKIGYHSYPKAAEEYLREVTALYDAIAAGKIPGVKLEVTP